MSATDELRELLDERGVKHRDYCDTTAWLDGSHVARADEYEDQLLVERVMTPEQAISATLGRGTCHVEQRQNPWGGFTEHCGVCGADLGCDTRNTQNFCPRCGVELIR